MEINRRNPIPAENEESLIERQQFENPLREIKFRRYSAFHRAFEEYGDRVRFWYSDTIFWVLVVKED